MGDVIDHWDGFDTQRLLPDGCRRIVKKPPLSRDDAREIQGQLLGQLEELEAAWEGRN